jgi:hypothetical protein
VVVSFKSDGVVFLCQVGRSENKCVSARPYALPRCQRLRYRVGGIALQLPQHRTSETTFAPRNDGRVKGDGQA